MSSQCSLGTSWRKVDMVQLGQYVEFLAVGKLDDGEDRHSRFAFKPSPVRQFLHDFFPF